MSNRRGEIYPVRTSSIKYWKSRDLELSKKVFDTADEEIAYIRKEYGRAINAIEEKIYYHLAKMAENSGISLAEAKKMLNNKELRAFKLSLEDFERLVGGFIPPKLEKDLDIISRRVRISRLQAMQIELKTSMAKLMNSEEKRMFAHLSKTYENTYYQELYGLQTITGYEQIKQLSKEGIEGAIYTPWSDKDFSKRIWDRGEKISNDLRAVLTRMMMASAAPKDIINSLSSKYKTSFYSAKRLIQTETSAIHSKARGDCYKAMNLEKFQILATLDLKTSEICKNMDGQVEDMTNYEIGVTAPPFHPHCRSVAMPYFDDEIQRSMDEKAGRMARNLKTGKSEKVEDLNYKQWYNKYVVTNKAKYSRFYTKKSLNSHFLKHKKEYPDFERIDYLERATELLNSEISDTVLGFESADGYIYRYDNQTNDLAIGKKDGHISTLFKPKRGLEYYNEQLQKFKKQ